VKRASTKERGLLAAEKEDHRRNDPAKISGKAEVINPFWRE
jgi:hypothetical protein